MTLWICFILGMALCTLGQWQDIKWTERGLAAHVAWEGSWEAVKLFGQHPTAKQFWILAICEEMALGLGLGLWFCIAHHPLAMSFWSGGMIGNFVAHFMAARAWKRLLEKAGK
jgi:hypothetical protein